MNKPIGAGLGWVLVRLEFTTDVQRTRGPRGSPPHAPGIPGWPSLAPALAAMDATLSPEQPPSPHAAHCAPLHIAHRSHPCYSIIRIPPMECSNPRIHELRLAKATCMVVPSRARTRFSLAHSLCGVRIQVGMYVARWEMGALT